MLLSQITPSSSLLITFHKRPLTSPVLITLISPTTGIPKYSLIASVPPANNPYFPLRRVRCCISGEDSSNETLAGSSHPASFSSVFVKGLPLSVSEGRLRKVFSEFGEVSNVKIIVKNRTRESLGYGYVWFTREDHAQLAAEAMNGKFFDGRFILVKLGQPGLSSGRRRSHSDFQFVEK